MPVLFLLSILFGACICITVFYVFELFALVLFICAIVPGVTEYMC